MEKKESLKDEFELRPPRAPGFSRRVFAIIKFILGICLLPFVYAVSASFLSEFGLIARLLQNYFWAGVISFLAIYLFIWEPVKIYVKGQKLLEFIFRFFAPLVKVAPYLLPVYCILIAISYSILSLIIKSGALLDYSIFLFGFTLIFHLVFSAKSMRSRQEDFLKSNYIFGFSFIYIINLTLLALFLNLMFEKFSFVNFFNHSSQIAKDIFGAVFKQFFL